MAAKQNRVDKTVVGLLMDAMPSDACSTQLKSLINSTLAGPEISKKFSTRCIIAAINTPIDIAINQFVSEFRYNE